MSSNTNTLRVKDYMANYPFFPRKRKEKGRNGTYIFLLLLLLLQAETIIKSIKSITCNSAANPQIHNALDSYFWNKMMHTIGMWLSNVNLQEDRCYTKCTLVVWSKTTWSAFTKAILHKCILVERMGPFGIFFFVILFLFGIQKLDFLK